MNFSSTYNQLVLNNPIKVLAAFLCLSIIAAYFSPNFELDASGESLILENDESLNYYREISQKYASDDFVVITFQPNSDLLSDSTINTIRTLRDDLLNIESIESINSILDVPIIYESGLKLSELNNELPSLETGNVDKQIALREFKTNPLYSELIVGKDASITALQALFKRDKVYDELLNRRQQLQSRSGDLSKKELIELDQIKKEIKIKNKILADQRELDIKSIRSIIDKQRDHGKLYMGGIPMITVDMIQFIRHDLLVFGSGVFLFLVIILSLYFHKVRWVMLPMLICGTTGLLTIGFMAYSGWATTVISSNFLSILLIITLSLTIHLIVRYRDLQLQHPVAKHKELVRLTMSSMAQPCFYTVLTTAVAFASLVVSEIRPVIDFGWIMVIGLGIAFVVSFTLMPATLCLLDEVALPPGKDITRTITLGMARLVHKHPVLIIFIALILIFAIGSGIPKLKVENRFINNFKSDTEIYQGMKIIDHKLGGTMPLDIIIDPDKDFISVVNELAEETNELDKLFFDDAENATQPVYWLNPTMLNKARQVQKHLESYPVTGKVISIVNSIDIIEKLNGAPFNEFELAVVRKRIPEEIEKALVSPYLSPDSNQIRFGIRVIESNPELNRKELLESIQHFLIEDMQFEKEQVHLTGMMVLYNNMLQSLFSSQILTIGAVFVAILFMFIILFRNISIALIAIVPNLFSAVLILGIMGWAGIPLDMMTITIAAITIGISVDDTIHYIHRLQKEFPLDQNYQKTIDRCHGGIGKAMYYTSIAIIFGFALLSFSNFIPTIYFGLLTGFAMLVALVGDLLLLPAIVVILKPGIT
ncbi:MAG: MMPL family transporter [Proteobacteria bacterium]|nr:RND family transporter [Pseudomonadota bacterium]NOG61766.1 MMPL family transporter [Pseudomonadota bacterium]